ncbi:dTDP-4-dehydrorhamnose reductase [Flavobacterium pallidum]|uniref:dTDP-4-dehydrorhamnose reductase n=1 Tax=Flavobacterium pallidum TaxID=2172098 RepID=A0A2S1SFA2_9FLAO|nr:dTDP-4-dehydrorhamnose reductase [Flavobacterium pallidum]AWI25080.1 dTDP-4-dehydrorhamnose reductase [Flavobacterium pallidum]
MVVLVTGSSGQLGQSLQKIAANHPQIIFHFYSSSELDITDLAQCETVFSAVKPSYCINAAAYTAVDKAESEPAKAFAVNVTGPENLAKVCREFGTLLIHISTDFVFDGNADKPYTEEDLPNPTGVYGKTKLEGEKAIAAIWDKHFIVRTSWVYSDFGNNFRKTMLRLASEKTSLSVVNDQFGTPTNALDLAEALITMIRSGKNTFGIYNFSNEGQCSWYDFANKIFEINKIKIDLQPIPTTHYPTPAKRPYFSVLDKSKIKKTFGIEISNWETSLKNK